VVPLLRAEGCDFLYSMRDIFFHRFVRQFAETRPE